LASLCGATSDPPPKALLGIDLVVDLAAWASTDPVLAVYQLINKWRDSKRALESPEFHAQTTYAFEVADPYRVLDSLWHYQDGD
jgi:hypothetical protein